MMHDIIHWKHPFLSFMVWIGVVGGVYTFDPWMITAALPPVLIMGRIAPGLFIQHKGAKKKKAAAAPAEEQEKKGLLEQKKALDKMILDVQKYIDFAAGLLEKGFHTFIWIRPQATFTLSIVLCIGKVTIFISSWEENVSEPIAGGNVKTSLRHSLCHIGF